MSGPVVISDDLNMKRKVFGVGLNKFEYGGRE